MLGCDGPIGWQEGRGATAGTLAEQHALGADMKATESLGQPGRPEKSLASHRELVDALRAQDSAAAIAAMLEHIELVSDVAR